MSIQKTSLPSRGRILIVAGGTGGHIYPALSVAQALKDLHSEIEIHFAGTPRGLENQIIPQEGYPLHHIPIGRLNRNIALKERLLTLVRLPGAFFRSWTLIRKLKPDLVVGFGGHASGPLLLMASLVRIPNAIWEPNAHPGMANRILSRFVDHCLVVFPEAAKGLKFRNLVQVGMPVRPSIEALTQNPTLEQVHRPLRVLVFGGSQGARGINRAVMEGLISQAESWDGQVEIVHQTGSADYAHIKSQYDQSPHPLPVQVFEYLHDMDQRYLWADLVVARAGTGTLSELAACARGSLLIPLPTAADNHQQKNAEVFAQQGAAIMILQKDFNGVSFSQMIEDFIAHPEKLVLMSRAVRSLHRPQAAQQMADLLSHLR